VLMPLLLWIAARLQTSRQPGMPAYIQAEWRDDSRAGRRNSLVDNHG